MRLKNIKNNHVFRISIGIAIIVLIMAAEVASASEFLVFNGEQKYVETDYGFQYFYRMDRDTIPSSWPSNWISPADYWNGVWQIRVQVKTRPSGTETKAFTFQPCIWQLPSNHNTTIAAELEACGSQFTMSNLGTYMNTNGPLASWWQKASGAQKPDFTRPYDIKRMGLVLRQASPECFITPYPSVEPKCWEQRYNYIPFDFHLTIVAVSRGSTFSGWSNYPISVGTNPGLPGLSVSISESSDPVTSGGTSQVTSRVTSGGIAVSGALVSVSTTCGSLSSYSGTTNSNGDLPITYTAQTVTSQQTCTISATASKTGYSSGSGSDLITVNPVSSTPTNPSGSIKNAGFESGTTSWVFHTDGTGTFTAASPGYGGTALAANLALNSGGTNVQLYQTGIPLEPNTRYRLSFAAKSSSGHDMIVYLHKHLTPYTNYGLNNYLAPLTTCWQTFSTEFTTTGFAGTVNDARLRFWLAPFAAAGDTYNIDNVILEKMSTQVPPPVIIPPPVIVSPIYLIKNLGFESGTISWLVDPPASVAFSTASPGYEGNYAANLALSSGTGVQLYQKDIILEPNTRYRLSFAAKSSTGHDLMVYLHKHGSPYTNYGLSYTAVLSTIWQPFSIEFTTTGFSGAVTDGRLRFWLAPFATAGDTYNIDNVRLEKI
jgi:hypothetical protein